MGKIHILILASLLGLAGCLEEVDKPLIANNGFSETQGSGAGFEQAASIKNDDLTLGLRGIDANSNGIRDDIDGLIERKYAGTPALKKAAEQKARALQKFMEANNKEQVLASGHEIGRAIACAHKVLPGENVERDQLRNSMLLEIEVLTANSKERFRKYMLSNKLADGSVFDNPKGPVCD